MSTAAATKNSPAKKTANSRTPLRKNRRVTSPSFQEPMIPKATVTAAAEPDRPSEHNGVAITREELISTPFGGHFRVSRLLLEGGGTGYACRDCLFTGDSRADVQHHRNAKHGTKYGKAHLKTSTIPVDKTLDLVLPPRPDGTPAPHNVDEMTIAEVRALMPTIGALSNLVEDTELENRALREELATVASRENQHKIDVYESLHEEVVGLRVAMKNTGSYEQLKAEVLKLRAWKKKMVQRLESLGFKLDEEDN